MAEKPLAFLSYSHLDDRDLGGLITRFRQRLTQAMRLRTGNDQLELFQDSTHIQLGEQWRERIHASLEEVTFLMPILTPRFFNSKECREELSVFMERERRLGRQDLVIPVYLIEYAALENEAEHVKDELLFELAKRQRADWRQVRQLSDRSRRLQKEFENLAERFMVAMQRATTGTGTPPPPVGPPVETVVRKTPVVVPVATEQTGPVAEDEPLDMGVASGMVVPGEAHLFELVLQAGLSYHVYAQPDDAGADLDLELYDESNILVGEDTTANRDAYCMITPRWTGQFQLVVFCVSGRGYYRVFVVPDTSVEPAGLDPVDVPTPPTVPELGVSAATGALMAGEEESFEVVLTADRSHEIYVRPDDPMADFDLGVFDEDGNLVEQDITTNSDALCVITPRWTGMFTVVVRAVVGASSYQLFVET